MGIPLLRRELFARAPVEESLQSKEFLMKKTILACACTLLLSTGSVFAQMQPAPGASSEGNVGPGATKSTTKHTNMKKGTTTGTATGKMKSSSSPSSMGNVGPGTNNNAGPQPGGR
jgi:hypothetical protein